MTTDEYRDLIADLGTKFGEVDSRFRAVDSRFERLEREMHEFRGEVDRRFTDVDQRMATGFAEEFRDRPPAAGRIMKSTIETFGQVSDHGTQVDARLKASLLTISTGRLNPCS